MNANILKSLGLEQQPLRGGQEDEADFNIVATAEVAIDLKESQLVDEGNFVIALKSLARNVGYITHFIQLKGLRQMTIHYKI